MNGNLFQERVPVVQKIWLVYLVFCSIEQEKWMYLNLFYFVFSL